MPDDIVERLRDPCFGSMNYIDDVAKEAADEIARLRAALRQYADEGNWAYRTNWCGDGNGWEVAEAALKGEQHA